TARHCGANELAKFSDPDHGSGIDLRGGIEDVVGAFEIARKQQQLGQQDPAAEFHRAFPHRGVRGIDCGSELSGAEQRAGGEFGFRHERRSYVGVPGAAMSVTRRNVAATSSSWKCGCKCIVQPKTPGRPGSSCTETRPATSGKRARLSGPAAKLAFT